MGKVRAVVCLLVLGSAFTVHGATDPGIYDPGPSKYLSYFESARNSGFLLEEARAEYLVSVEREKKDIELYDMKTKLFGKGAVSENELRIAERERDVSVAQTRVWRDRVDWLEHTVGFNKIGAAVSAGAPVDLDAFYANYLAEWEAQCRVFKSEVVAAEARLKLATYQAGWARKLFAKSAVSYVEVLDKEFESKAMDARLAKAHILDNRCLTDLPTLDFVKKIPHDKSPAAPTPPVTPSPAPPAPAPITPSPVPPSF